MAAGPPEMHLGEPHGVLDLVLISFPAEFIAGKTLFLSYLFFSLTSDLFFPPMAWITFPYPSHF